MVSSSKYTVVLDTNVLIPYYLRDLLLWMAWADMFTPKWSPHIIEEWKKYYRDKGESEKEIDEKINPVINHFGFAMVDDYEKIIDVIELPDPNDRHVVAVGIRTNANQIVTCNLKDFPNDYLLQFGLGVKGPDEFLVDTIDLDPSKAVETFQTMVNGYKNPKLDEFGVLEIYRKNNLTQTADFLHSQI